MADVVVEDDSVTADVDDVVLLSSAIDELPVKPSGADAAVSASGLSKRSMTAFALDNIDLAKLSLTNMPNQKTDIKILV